MAESKTRCKICLREWPTGTLPECPDYRNQLHRRRRTTPENDSELVTPEVTMRNVRQTRWGYPTPEKKDAKK